MRHDGGYRDPGDSSLGCGGSADAGDAGGVERDTEVLRRPVANAAEAFSPAFGACIAGIGDVVPERMSGGRSSHLAVTRIFSACPGARAKYGQSRTIAGPLKPHGSRLVSLTGSGTGRPSGCAPAPRQSCGRLARWQRPKAVRREVCQRRPASGVPKAHPEADRLFLAGRLQRVCRIGQSMECCLTTPVHFHAASTIL